MIEMHLNFIIKLTPNTAAHGNKSTPRFQGLCATISNKCVLYHYFRWCENRKLSSLPISDHIILLIQINPYSFDKNTHLDSLFLQIHLQSERFARHHVRIVSCSERFLQLLQLLLGEDRPMAALPLRRRPMMVMMMMAHMMVGSRRGGCHRRCCSRIVMMMMVVMRMRHRMLAVRGAAQRHMSAGVHLSGSSHMGDGRRMHVVGVEIRVGHCSLRMEETCY